KRQMEQEMVSSPDFNTELNSYRGLLDQAQASGVILVKAAGNDTLPAMFDAMSYSRRVISVAATDQKDARAPFSRYGEYTTVSAAGVAVHSAYSDPNKRYVEMQGTSMAAPHVAGVVALMKSLKPDLTFEEVRQILQTTGRPLKTDKPIGPLVAARAALDEVARRVRERVPPPTAEPPLTPPPPQLPPEGSTALGVVLDGAAPRR